MEYAKQTFDALKNELQVCKRRLDSKSEAVLILSGDLSQCKQERDQFKLMAEQIQNRYQMIKRQLSGVGPKFSDSDDYSNMKQKNLAELLCDMRDQNKNLKFQVDDLKQKLDDANGDIKLLREQIARHRLGCDNEGIDTRFISHDERQHLVATMEGDRCKIHQLERDLQQLLDEKEEMVMERDQFKNKYQNLNKELNRLLGGCENKILDIDALVAENKYLSERLKQVDDERIMALTAVSKYKSILDKRRSKGNIKLGQNRGAGLVISQKQVHELLSNSNLSNPTPQMIQDIHSLASSLLDSLNDKSVALSHQRKTNKILGSRVDELESKLKELERIDLKNIMAEKSLSLIRLKEECLDVKKSLNNEQHKSSSSSSPPPSHHHHHQNMMGGDAMMMFMSNGVNNHNDDDDDDDDNVDDDNDGYKVGQVTKSRSSIDKGHNHGDDDGGEMSETRKILDKLHELFLNDESNITSTHEHETSLSSSSSLLLPPLSSSSSSYLLSGNPEISKNNSHSAINSNETDNARKTPTATIMINDEQSSLDGIS